MGGCCPGGEAEKGPTERTSLLSGGVTSQQPRPRGISVDDPPQYTPDAPATSARKHKPSDSIIRSSRNIGVVNIKQLSMVKTRVANVDKRIEDHANLFNYHLARFNDLHEELRELKSIIAKDDPDISIKECFKDIRNRLGEAKVSIKRKYKYCMEIEYDAKTIFHHTVAAFQHFNKANRLVRDIIDKGPPLTKSVELVIQEESQLRRDIVVASLGDEGPDAIKSCMDNIAHLKTVPDLVESIKNDSLTIFEELKDATTVLMQTPGESSP